MQQEGSIEILEPVQGKQVEQISPRTNAEGCWFHCWAYPGW